MRNTPILVNKLPATIEYLGENYPLFYDDLNHAAELISSIRAIYRGYRYLKAMKKDKFTINHFIKHLSDCV